MKVLIQGCDQEIILNKVIEALGHHVTLTPSGSTPPHVSNTSFLLENSPADCVMIFTSCLGPPHCVFGSANCKCLETLNGLVIFYLMS